MKDFFTQEALRALLMSLAAGMSTLLGALIILFTKRKNERLITASLGFAAGVMISVSFVDLLPGAWEGMTAFVGHAPAVLLSVLLLLIGVLLSAGLDRLVPHETVHGAGEDERRHQNLFRAGFVSMLAMSIHNFPEGIATFMAGYEDAALGISITLAIAFHNIPEGITVAMPIYFSTGSRRKAFRYTFLSGIAEPIGAVLAFLLLRPLINGLVLGLIFSLISGIMLYIAIEELIPSSREYGYTRLALWSTFAGIALMPLTLVFG